MKLQSKFNVNDLLARKFDSNGNKYFHIFEVLEIITNTCYAGTQFFYLCRPITGSKEYKEKYKDSGEFKWIVRHVIGNNANHTPGKLYAEKYREDELVLAPKRVIDIVLKSKINIEE